MNLDPYLNFNGRAEEAIEFYKKAIGAKVNMLMRFKEMPDPQPGVNPAFADKVMHASLSVGQSDFSVSDGRCQGATKFEGISLSLRVADSAEAQRVFTALSDGGLVTMPLAKTFFSSQFGMVQDRFGISWMIIAAH